MGVFQNIRSAFGALPRPDYLATPFNDADSYQLTKVILAELFDVDLLPLSLEQALSIPSLSKARDILCSSVAALPLKAADVNGVLPPEKQPTWMYRTNDGVPPFLRMLFTVEDLMFYGRSLWAVDRGTDGQILFAARVLMNRWKVTPEGAITINDQLVNADDVIYFQSPKLGILDIHGTSIRAARSVALAVEQAALNPIPMMEIHATDSSTEPTPDEAKQLVTDYNAARRTRDGGTIYTPASIQLIDHGTGRDAGYLSDARNGVRLDMANITGIPASLLEGSVATASLTYSTQAGKRNEFADYGLTIWLEAIEGRLSQDDVVPRGQHTVFDETDYLTVTPSPTGPEGTQD